MKARLDKRAIAVAHVANDDPDRPILKSVCIKDGEILATDGFILARRKIETEGKAMKIEEARLIAERVKEKLSPHCDRIEIAGSIRREKPTVHDIDIVLIEKPGSLLEINEVLASIGSMDMNGSKIKRLWYGDTEPGISIDIYVATPATWATLLLIRTGSKENNIRLCSLARQLGLQLKANGDGLFNESGQRLAGDTEQSIYEVLRIPYQEPNEREVKGRYAP